MRSKLWGRQHQCASFPGWSIVSWRWAHCQQTHTDSWRPSGKTSQVCKHYTHWLGSSDLVHTTQQYKLIWCIMCVHTISNDISTCCVCCAQVWYFNIKRYGTFYNTGMILWYIKVWYFGVCVCVYIYIQVWYFHKIFIQKVPEFNNNKYLPSTIKACHLATLVFVFTHPKPSIFI